MRGRIITLLVVVAAAAAFGLLISAQGVRCGQAVMSPGDRCVRGGVTRSYADEVSANKGRPLRFGLFALGVGVVILVLSVRDERRRTQGRPRTRLPR